MEVLQLLVEIVPQALQFFGVAQFVGVHDLVETVGISLVVRPALIRALRLRLAAIRRFLGVASLAFFLEFRRGRLDGVHGSFVGVVGAFVGSLALHRILRRLVFALAFCLVWLVGRRLILRLFVRLFRLGVGVVREPQGRENLPDQPAIG